jgi:hypothetical protein
LLPVEVKKYLIPLLFAAVKFAICFIFFNHAYDFHRDEFLYIEEGNHLAWGYVEIPPLLPVLAAISHLLGNSFFSIKLWPALFGAFTIFLTGTIVIELGGKWYAQFLACLGFLLSAYLRIHILFQPNFLDIFWWTLFSYYMIRWIKTQKNRFIYYLAFAVVLGLSSKYSMGFYLMGIFTGLILTSHRKIFLNKHLYIAAGISLLFLLPNIIWEFMHKFPVVQQLTELQQTQLQYLSPFKFLLNQLLLVISALPIWLFGLYFLLFKKEEKPFRLFGFAYVTLIAVLFILHGKDYYSLGIYPMLLAFGSVYFERIAQQNSIAKLIVRILPVLFALVISYVLFPIALPMLSPENAANFFQKTGAAKIGVLTWEDGKTHPLPQDFADMLGWNEMAEKAAGFYNEVPDSEKKCTMIFGDNYGEAGALCWYASKFNMPEAVSLNSNFAFWMHAPACLENLIYVNDEMPDPHDPIINHFARIVKMDSVTNPLAREHRAVIIWFQHPDHYADSLLALKIKMRRADYSIK